MNRRRHGGWIGLSRAVIAALLITASVTDAQEPPTDGTIAYWVVEALRRILQSSSVRLRGLNITGDDGTTLFEMVVIIFGGNIRSPRRSPIRNAKLATEARL